MKTPMKLLAGSLALVFGAALLSGCDSPAATKTDFQAAITAEPETGNAPVGLHFVARHNGGLEDEVIFLWTFGDGETGEGKEIDHVYQAAGTYTVELVAEDSELGTATATLEVEIAASADLNVSDVNVGARTVRPGGELQVTGGLSNDGATTIGEFSLTWVLSTDTSLSDDDLRLLVDPRDGLAEGVPLEGLDKTFTLPAELASGEYYAGIVADAEAYIGDSNRENNVAFSSFAVEIKNATDTGPDLVICGLTVPAFAGLRRGDRPQVQQGDQIEVTVCVANAGNEPTIDAAVEVLLSRDAAASDDDLPVLTRDGQTLGQGDRFEETVVVDLPFDLMVGEWFVVAVADRAGVIEEQSEDNNVESTPDPLNVVAPGEVEGVDLVVTRFESEVEKAFWGQAFPVDLTIVNRGQTPVLRNFVLRVEAAPSDGRDPVTVSSLNINGLPAGEERALEVDVPVTQRIEPGQYCLRAVVDPTGSAMDANPGNNGRRGPCVQLGGDPDVDFSVRSVSFEPAAIEAGQMVRVQGTVQNLGDDQTGEADAAIFFSADEQVDAGDIAVLRFTLDPIAPGESAEVDEMVLVPIDLDQNVAEWRVVLVADPNERVTAEAVRENNQAFAPMALVVTGAMGGCAEDAEFEDNDSPNRAQAIEAGAHPALGLCDGVDWYEVEVPAGSALFATVTVNPVSFATHGQVPSLSLRTSAGVALSEGDAFGAVVTGLVEPAAVDRTLLLGLESPAELGYALDITLLAAGDEANLRPRGLSVAPGSLGAGAFVTVEVEAVNLGGAAAGDSRVGLYLVAPGEAPEDGQRLGELEVPAIEDATALPVSGVVTIPEDAADGDFELVARLDDRGEIDESNEADNDLRVPLVVTAEGACTSDPFEPNRSDRLADGGSAVVATVAAGAYEGLSVCANDDDWYAVALMPGEGLRAAAAFDAAGGDIDLYLFASDGETELDSSRSMSGDEAIEFFGTIDGGIVYLRVVVRPGAAGPTTENTYSLTVEIDPPGGCEPDDFEPNGSTETAADLTDGDYVLTLCPGLEDWFRFSLVAGNTVSFQARSDADLQLALYDPDGEVVDEDELTAVWDAEFDGIYRLQVQTASPIPVSYTLRVRGASGLDLEATELSVAPQVAAAGDEVRVEGRVRNVLGDTVNDVAVRLLLSDDDLPSPDDVELGRLILPRVGSVEPADFRLRVRIPDRATAGEKYVVLEVDPDRALADARRPNNLLAAPLSVRSACVDDDRRTNEGPETATPLVEGDSSADGVICGHTEDWYALEVAASGTLTVAITFDTGAGDLDLFLLDEAGEELGQSATELSPESVEVDVPGVILIRVDGFLDAEAPYTLSWSVE